jgi:hypothetical protein
MCVATAVTSLQLQMAHDTGPSQPAALLNLRNSMW